MPASTEPADLENAPFENAPFENAPVESAPVDFESAPFDPSASALRTPLKLPEIQVAPPGHEASAADDATPDDATPDDATPDDAAEPGSFYAASQYHFAPNDSLAVRLERAAEERLGTPERASLADAVERGARLPLLLERELPNMTSNLYLQVSGIDEEMEATATGFEYWGGLEGCESLPSAPALAVWVSGDYAHTLRLGALRRRLEENTTPDFAAEVVRRCTDAFAYLMPVWDEARTYEYIRELHWYGWEDDSERIDEMKHELAHSRDCEPGDVTDEEAREAASGYFWTAPYVQSLLAKPYRTYRRSKLNAFEMKRRLREAGLRREAELLENARALEKVTRQFTDTFDFKVNGGTGYDHMYRALPWGLLSTTDEDGFDGAAGNLVAETFEEEARHEAESGHSPMPIAGLVFNAESEDGRAAFFEFVERLEACMRLCRRFACKIDEGSIGAERDPGEVPLPWEEHPQEEAGGSGAGRSRRAAQAKGSRTLPAAYLNESGQIDTEKLSLNRALSALGSWSKANAHRALPSGTVPAFL